MFVIFFVDDIAAAVYRSMRVVASRNVRFTASQEVWAVCTEVVVVLFSMPYIIKYQVMCAAVAVTYYAFGACFL